MTKKTPIFGTGSDELNNLILQQEHLENQKFVKSNLHVIRMSESWDGIRPKTRLNDSFAPNPTEPKDPLSNFFMLLIGMGLALLFIYHLLLN